VVITLEAEGAWIEDAAGGRRVPGHRVEVVDSTGAGDAFTGCLAVELGSGRSIDDAVARANRAGAFCVTRMGVVPGLGGPEDLASIGQWPVPEER
jgi:ribokinase